MPADAALWNHSTHDHRDALRLVGPTTRTALDVGCGEGLLTRRLWEHTAPVAEPEETHAQVRKAASALTPGATLRRRLYWRYSLVWRKPGVSVGR